MITRHACLMLLLAGTATAQTTIYGSSATAPTKIYGDPTITTVLNAASTYTKIYVVFPPQSSSITNTHFVNYVMTQPSIDGVTLQVPWNVVEINPPTQTDCTVLSPPANNPDQCQPDPFATGWFHTYDSWSTIDGSGCSDYSPNSSSQWFCQFGGVYKSVNFVLVGIGGAPINTVTPTYVTLAWWVTAANPGSTPYLHEDAVNTINASSSSCTSGNYSGSIPNAPTSASFLGDNTGPPSLINVTSWGTSPHPVEGDTIWVSGFTTPSTALNVTGQYGAAVHQGTNCPSNTSADFCYVATGQTGASGFGSTSIHIVKAVDSWPVPYEQAYAGAWQGFLTAAIYHFNHYANVNQIAYIRPGVARGGEAIPLCTTAGPLGGGAPGTTPPYTKGEWQTWYTSVNTTVQAAQPHMQIVYSINSGDVQAKNVTYATGEAGIAVSYSSATGLYNGFGSQGLQIADDTSFGTCPGTSGPPTTSNNWGCMFTQYWSGGSTPTTVPLELQQVDCSNPSGYVPLGTSNCFIGSTGLTGDLRTVYPFATSNHVSILELYHHDALLAFDPFYCVVSVSTCAFTTNPLTSSDSFGTDLSLDAQYDFFNNPTDAVGIDHSCYTKYNVPDPGDGKGTCQYAATITAAHGPH
jgi:hypothetical protein